MAIEPWKQLQPIPSLQGFYGATQDGRIVRLVGGSGTRAGKELKQSSNPAGYLNVAPCIDGRTYQNGVHRYVAEAFYGSIPDGMFVCHTNHDVTDNRIENLWIGSSSQNSEHSRDTIGNIGQGMRGVPPPSQKLDQRDYDEIKRLYSEAGFPQKLLAGLYGITQGHVSAITLNKVKTA